MKLLHTSKKLVALLLAIMLLIAVPVQALAPQEGAADASDLIIRALQDIEPLKEEMGYGDIDFTALSVGDPIHAYRLTEEGLSFSRLIYPLFENGELVVLGLEVTSNNTQHIQLTLALVDEIKATVDHDEPVALVYMEKGCYLYTGSDITQIAQSEGMANITVQYPSSLSLEIIIESEPILTVISPKYNLEYIPTIMPLAETYYYCRVSWVSQPIDSNICWAATSACISNYIDGTRYSALDVVKMWFPDYTYPEPAGSDYSLSIKEAILVLNGEFGLGYSHVYADELDDNMIIENLRDGYPIYSSWKSSVSGHAVTIYGIHLNGGYLNLMCPINKSITAYWDNGNYSYISPSSDNEFTLRAAACRWT